MSLLPEPRTGGSPTHSQQCSLGAGVGERLKVLKGLLWEDSQPDGSEAHTCSPWPGPALREYGEELS